MSWGFFVFLFVFWLCQAKERIGSRITVRCPAVVLWLYLGYFFLRARHDDDWMARCLCVRLVLLVALLLLRRFARYRSESYSISLVFSQRILKIPFTSKKRWFHVKGCARFMVVHWLPRRVASNAEVPPDDVCVSNVGCGSDSYGCGLIGQQSCGRTTGLSVSPFG